LGHPHPPYSYIGDIAGNYERISTKLSATNPLTRLMSIWCKNNKICYRFLGQPHPQILI